MRITLCLRIKHKLSLIYQKSALHFVINGFIFSNVTLTIKSLVTKFVKLYKILNNAKN